MNRTALVTGAAAGIGRACALRLAEDGMAIGVLDLDLAGCERVVAEIEAMGGRAVALRASIADRPEVQAAVDTLRTRFGPVAVLVNNAGISEYVAFEDLTDAQWDRMFEINTKGTFIVTQIVLPDMKAAGWGRIVNISSSSAQTGSIPQVHYSSSKGAVITMTRSLAQALGPLGITVNNIPPGSVLGTIMADKNISRETINALENSLPVRRVGEPADIANACAWLCLDASSYVTGQTIGVNGGRVVS